MSSPTGFVPRIAPAQPLPTAGIPRRRAASPAAVAPAEVDGVPPLRPQRRSSRPSPRRAPATGTERSRQRLRHRPIIKPTIPIGLVDMTTTDAPKVTLCSWVDRDLRQELERLAIQGDRSLSAEIRRACAAHVEHSAWLERTTTPASAGGRGAMERTTMRLDPNDPRLVTGTVQEQQQARHEWHRQALHRPGRQLGAGGDPGRRHHAVAVRTGREPGRRASSIGPVATG